MIRRTKEMKQKKEINQKKKTLNIYPFSTEEYLNQKLNSTLFVEKLQIQLTQSKDFNLIFLKVKDYLIKKKEQVSLEIILKQIQNFDFEHSLFLLKDIPQITSLIIQFTSIQFKSFQQQTLVSCLSNFTNLITLTLQFHGKQLDTVEEFYSLNEAYSHLINLKILNIQLDDFQEGSTAVYSILEGMGKLLRLETFQFSIQSKIKCSYVIYCIEKELKYIPNLKKFSLELGLQSSFNCYDLKAIGNILLSLQKLENLKLIGYFYHANKCILLTGLEDSIAQLKQLKECNFQFYCEGENINIYPLLDILSQIESLERITLSLYFKLSLFELNLQQLGQSFAKISKLSKLHLTFLYGLKFSMQQFYEFLNELEPLNQLENLDLNIGELKKSSELENYKGIKQTLKKLKKFRFNAYELIKDDYFYFDGQLISCIKEAQNLENLYFKLSSIGNDDRKIRDFTITDLLFKKESLVSVDIQVGAHYQINEIDYQTLIEQLQFNSSLQTIIIKIKSKLSYNNQIMKQMSSAFSVLYKLVHLELELTNQIMIDEKGYQSFCEIIPSLTQLTYLSLSIFKDTLSTSALNKFVCQLQSMKKLLSLQLSIIGTNFNSDEEEINFGNSFKLPLKIQSFHFSFQIEKLKYSNLQNFFQELSKMRKLLSISIIFYQLIINLTETIQLRRYLSKLQILNEMKFQGCSINLIYLVNLFQDIKSLEKISLESFKCYLSNQAIARRFYKEIIQDKHNNHYIQQDNRCKGNRQEFISIMIKYGFQPSQDQNIEDLYNHQFIFVSIHFLQKLSLQFFSNNKIGSKVALEIFKNINNLINLQELSIRISENNQVGTESIIQLGYSLIELNNLRTLEIVIYSQRNDINWQQSYEFLNSLSNLKQLEHLELGFEFTTKANIFNCIESQFLNSLFNSIKQIKQLNYLKLNFLDCYLTNINISEFSSMIDALSNTLKSLVFYFPDCENYQQFIKSIFKLQYLQFLTLKINLQNHAKPLQKMKRLSILNFSTRFQTIF